MLSDITIQVGSNAHKHLALGYQPDWLPSFALPPASPADLKLVQGSCRGSNGIGRDALPPLDDILKPLIQDPKQRPHMMFLTGDQVYSDEGAPEFVEMLQKLSSELLGGVYGASVETIAIDFPQTDTEEAETMQVRTDADHLPAGRRGHVMTDLAHFTSDHTDSHAMGFGEFCANYLTAYCNVCWRDWDPLKLLSDRAARFTDYLTNTRQLHDTLLATAFQYKDPTIGDSTDAVREMMRYFHAWRLVPEAYRSIDFYLSSDDVAAAWGKGNPDDNARFDLWTNFANARLPGAPHLPIDPAQKQPAAPTSPDLTAKQMNRLARAMSPSWFAGKEIFGIEFDFPDKPGDLTATADLAYNRIHRLDWFYQDLPKVRRILANIPTYMVFDDHEITDDWNITPGWAKKTRGNSLGRAVVRNGLAAFAVFQYWGNDPLACRKDQPGGAALDFIEQLFLDVSPDKPGPDADMARSLEHYFDLDLVDPPKTDERMIWHFRYDGPKYEVLALDSRTWRAFEPQANDSILEPFSDEATAALLTNEALLLQVPEQPAPGVNPDGFCIVIAAAPVLGFPPVESVAQPLINVIEMVNREPDPPFKRWGRSLKFGRVAHDPETWGFTPWLFEGLLSRLSSRARVIFFSGDVHYSFGSHMDYWRLNPDGSQQGFTRFVQLTASSMRAQQPRYPAVFAIDLLQQLGAALSKTNRYGWNRGPAGSPTGDPPLEPGAKPFGTHLTQVLLDNPIVISPEGVPDDALYRRMPEWAWEMDVEADQRASADRFTNPPPPPFVTSADTAEVAASVARRHVWQARFSMPRRWHWWTNITTVGFNTAPDGSLANVMFQVYSYDPDGVAATAEPFMNLQIPLTATNPLPAVKVTPKP